MISSLLGKKIGMTQMFDEKGNLRPVTVLEVGPCHVMQVRTAEKEGYWAVQIGFEDRKRKKAKKPQLVQARALGLEPKKFVREICLQEKPEVKAGEDLNLELFKNVRMVDIAGTSKGKGFAGVMKRWGFKGAPASHGASKIHRSPGSIGGSSDPSRVFKGTKMPGHLGAQKCTVRNLRILRIDSERNLLVVEGAVPGPKGGYLVVSLSRAEVGKNS